MSSLVNCSYTVSKRSLCIQRYTISLNLLTFNGEQTNILLSLGSKGLGEKTHHFTLLDGEMVIDTLPDSQKQERRYLIYDMMAINQVSIIEVWFILYT